MMAAWRGGHDAGKHDGHVKEHFSKQHFGTHYRDLPLNTMPFQLRVASKAMEIFSAQAPFRIWVKGLSQVSCTPVTTRIGRSLPPSHHSSHSDCFSSSLSCSSSATASSPRDHHNH